MKKKVGWASIDSSRLDIAERRVIALGIPVRHPLMSIGAQRRHWFSHSVTVTPGRVDLIASMKL